MKKAEPSYQTRRYGCILMLVCCADTAWTFFKMDDRKLASRIMARMYDWKNLFGRNDKIHIFSYTVTNIIFYIFNLLSQQNPKGGEQSINLGYEYDVLIGICFICYYYGQYDVQLIIKYNSTMIYRPSIVLVSFYFLPLLFGSSSATASNTQNTQNNNILEKYDDHRWSRLPEWVREAAIVLSYTEELWDNDQEPEETEDQHWHELTSEQQDAAAALGYTAECGISRKTQSK